VAFRKTGEVQNLGVAEVSSHEEPQLTPAQQAAALIRGRTLTAEEAEELRLALDAASKTADHKHGS
jgi:hypothetical protein